MEADTSRKSIQLHTQDKSWTCFRRMFRRSCPPDPGSPDKLSQFASRIGGAKSVIWSFWDSNPPGKKFQGIGEGIVLGQFLKWQISVPF